MEITPIPDGEGEGYAARIPLLGRWSAVGDGESPEAAYADLRAALTSLLEDWIRRSAAIPEPDAEAASEEGVSLNQWITAALAHAIGSRTGKLGKKAA